VSRYKAALIHLLISAVLVSNVIAVVFWVWYPHPAFEAVGAFSIIRLLVVVDLVMGPTLTLVVYKQGKPGLKFDLTVIAIMQVVALIYGSYTLYVEKPKYMVFVIDRVEFVSRSVVDESAIRFDELRKKRFAKLIQVFARPPEDPAEYQRYLDSVVFEGKPDLERRTEFYEPWVAGADAIRRKVKPIEQIKAATSRERKNVQRAIDQYAETHPNLGILPIGAIERDVGMLLDRDTLEILGVLDANPWKQD
jgi:hypothetical protein